MTGLDLLMVLALRPPFMPAAWGEDGHRIVCEIAFREANVNTQAQIRALLASDAQFPRFADACIWADDVRARARANEPAFRRFARLSDAHFMNLPRDAAAVSATGCTRVVNGERQPCIIDAITEFTNVLRTSTNARTRQEALKFMGHFVGDIHQPLHVGYGDDRGGNNEQVVLPSGEQTNLHSVWDSFLIASAGKRWQDYARELQADINPIDRATWSNLDPVTWARESYQVVEDDVYEDRAGGRGARPLIDRGYFLLNQLTLERRLKQAGVRLARLLEQALGTGTS
ncbi:MAG: S1/P1 nuclease [Longimicrobiales bacterium]